MKPTRRFLRNRPWDPRWIGLLLLMLVGMGGLAAGTAAAQVDARAEIRGRLERLETAGRLSLGGERVGKTAALLEAYRARDWAPIWSELAAGELRHAVADASNDGLDPADYHLGAIDRLGHETGSRQAAADLDILRSDAFLRLAHDLGQGKVDPETGKIAQAIGGTIGGVPAGDVLGGIAAGGGVAATIARLRPSHFVYTGLRAALAEHRRILAAGGWREIPSGPPLELGDVDERIPGLRERLVLSGDLPPAFGTSGNAFDLPLHRAVRSFQRRNGLNEDGVVGPATREAMNVPVSTRIDQVRLNLERARWYARDLPPTFLTVNAAGARVYLVHGDQIAWDGRAIVGQTTTRTPIFRDQLEYIELNPTWTVPPGIVGEVLQAIRRDAGYLERMDFQILDAAGRPIRISRAELLSYSSRNFPYTFRQRPGPLNPLGRLKFVFPNALNVYLHDTPARELFDYEVRAFSHGCIRVQDPVGLAEMVLADPAWSRAAIESAIETGETRRVTLARPLPVLILYWTASADPDGRVYFYPDLYGRDADLLRALDRPR